MDDLPERLIVVAQRVQNALYTGDAEYLMGWEHITIAEAVTEIRTLRAKLADALEQGVRMGIDAAAKEAYDVYYETYDNPCSAEYRIRALSPAKIVAEATAKNDEPAGAREWKPVCNVMQGGYTEGFDRNREYEFKRVNDGRIHRFKMGDADLSFNVSGLLYRDRQNPIK